MKAAIALLLLLGSAFSQVAPSTQVARGLTIELRTSSDRVRIGDDITLTVVFRSPERETTIWNFLAWTPNSGMYLKVFDASGREVPYVFPTNDPIPPDPTGKDALLSIGGNVFAGFEDRIGAQFLFPRPGRYTIKCLYSPLLPRHYFKGRTIWGKEDGPVESPGVTVLVDQ